MNHIAKTEEPAPNRLKRILRKGTRAGATVIASLAFLEGTLHAETAARVGSREIDLDQLEALMPELTPSEKMAFAANPETFNQYVRSLLIRQVVHEAAIENEWDLNPKAQEAIERARQSAIVESYLQAVAGVPEDFPSEEQLTAFYEANRASFTAPRQYDLSQVFLSTSGSENPEALEERANKIRQAILEERIGFAEAAEKFSEEEASAENGGRIGWVAEDNLQPDLKPLIAELEPGEITDVVRLPNGFHIVRLEETREEFTVPFEEVRSRLAAQLRARRAQANREAFLQRLIDENPVALNEIVVGELLEERTE